MERLLQGAITTFLILILAVNSHTAEPHQFLTSISLSAPADRAACRYLGISGPEFRLQEVQASAVIIEIFNMYCPYCQSEAPKVNRLYDLIESESALKGRVKLIGIGAGNSDFEVDLFRESFGIPFPLFSDENGEILRRLGRIQTPLFIVMKIKEETGSIVFVHAGGFTEPADFLDTVISRSAIRTGEQERRR
jgi:peroxiredoxin